MSQKVFVVYWYRNLKREVRVSAICSDMYSYKNLPCSQWTIWHHVLWYLIEMAYKYMEKQSHVVDKKGILQHWGWMKVNSPWAGKSRELRHGLRLGWNLWHALASEEDETPTNDQMHNLGAFMVIECNKTLGLPTTSGDWTASKPPDMAGSPREFCWIIHA